MTIRDDKALLITKHALERMNEGLIDGNTLFRGIENILPTLIGEQRAKVFTDGRKLFVIVQEGKTRRTIKTIFIPDQNGKKGRKRL